MKGKRSFFISCVSAVAFVVLTGYALLFVMESKGKESLMTNAVMQSAEKSTEPMPELNQKSEAEPLAVSSAETKSNTEEKNDSSASSAKESAVQSASSKTETPKKQPETKTKDDTATLKALRSTLVYEVVKTLNPNADFTAANARGNVRYLAKEEAADSFETADGKPDYAAFSEKGLDCAAFINYFFWNYMPNVKRIDLGLKYQTNPENSDISEHKARLKAAAIAYTMEYNNVPLVYSAGELAEKKSYKNISTSDYQNGKINYQIGDVILFSNSAYRWYHVGIYAGYYNGKHWIAHSTIASNSVGVTLSSFNGYSYKWEKDTIYVTRVWRVNYNGTSIKEEIVTSEEPKPEEPSEEPIDSQTISDSQEENTI